MVQILGHGSEGGIVRGEVAGVALLIKREVARNAWVE